MSFAYRTETITNEKGQSLLARSLVYGKPPKDWCKYQIPAEVRGQLADGRTLVVRDFIDVIAENPREAFTKWEAQHNAMVALLQERLRAEITKHQTKLVVPG